MLHCRSGVISGLVWVDWVGLNGYFWVGCVKEHLYSANNIQRLKDVLSGFVLLALSQCASASLDADEIHHQNTKNSGFTRMMIITIGEAPRYFESLILGSRDSRFSKRSQSTKMLLTFQCWCRWWFWMIANLRHPSFKDLDFCDRGEIWSIFCWLESS